MALARLNGHLGDLSANVGKANGSADVVHTDSLPGDFPCTFKLNKFQFAEFDQINQAAYLDYQREKVLIKSSERLRRIARKARTKNRLNPAPTKP